MPTLTILLRREQACDVRSGTFPQQFPSAAQALNAVASHSQVLYVSPDRIVDGKLEFAAPAVGADLAFNSGWTGSGVGIAILDSGINPEHPDIKGRIVNSENFVTNETTTDDPYGHGTHVAVAAAGNAYASTGNSYIVTFRGIAPRAHLANFRVLDQTAKVRIPPSSLRSTVPSN